GDWITFCDPDDFVDYRYFEQIDRFMDAHPKVGAVACRMVYYDDASRLSRNQHPLRFRFKDGNREVELRSMDRDFHLAANTILLPTKMVKESGLTFDERVRPTFEDAH